MLVEPVPPVQEHPPAPTPRVLVLTADPALADDVQQLIGDTHAVTSAASGDAAGPGADFILLDETLADAARELARIRALGTTRPPVLVVEDEEPALHRGGDLEGDEVIVRPLRARELRRRLRALGELARVRREAAERVRESEERFRHVADNSPLMFWVTGPDGECVYLNERWLEFTGQSAPEGLGVGWMNAIHPNDVAATRTKFLKALSEQAMFRCEYRLRRHDGVYRWVIDSGAPRRRDGRFVGFVGSVLDITDKREEFEAIDRSHSQMQLALQAARSGTFDWEFATGRVTWSPELERLYGVIPGTFGGTFRAWAERVVPEDVVAVEQVIQRCLAAGAEYTDYEFRAVMPDGSQRWLEGKARFDYAPGGKPRRMTGINVDIDARKRAELNALFIDGVSQAVTLLKEPAAIMDQATRALGEHLHVQRCSFFERPGGTGLVNVVHEWRADPAAVSGVGDHDLRTFGVESRTDDPSPTKLAVNDVTALPALARAVDRFQALGIRAFARARLRREHGRIVTLVAISDHVRVWRPDELEVIENLLARTWPLVERARGEQAIQRAEAKTRESEERLRISLQAARLGTWDFNPRTRQLVWDERCKELFGLAPDAEVTWDVFTAAVHPDDRARTLAAVTGALQPSGRGQYDIEIRSRATERSASRWLRATGKAFFGPDGQPTRFLGTVMDISDVVRARETLAGRQAELEQLVAERTAKLQDTIGELEGFSYSISHDLRAPLRAMQSFAQLLAEDHAGRLNDEGRDYLRRIINASKRMDRLIHDVLVYSRVSRTELQLGAVNLGTLVDGILESYPQFQASTTDIVVRRPLPRVIGNEAALTQCVSNLLGNAVKFVRPGARPRIELWAETTAGRSRLFIRDNGIGIPREAQDKIFGIFERLSREYDGTGIGLAVVRKAAERMGGSVSVESTPGEGSTFCLELRTASED